MLYQVTQENLPRALETVREGKGQIWLRTAYKAIYINAKTLASWSSVPSKPLLTVEGEGFRMRQGKSSVYVFPGQLVLETYLQPLIPCARVLLRGKEHETNNRTGNCYYRIAGATMKPKCKLIGQDGNIFNLAGLASKTLKKAGQADKAKEMTSKIFACGSYEEALAIIGEYVEIE